MERDGDYERGHLAGEVAARLAGHDQHFAAINGHLAEMSRDLRAVREAMPKPPLLSPVARLLAEMAGLAAFAAFASWVISIVM